MKKSLLFITILFIAISSFAQKKSLDENFNQLIHAKNGMGPVDTLSPKLVQGISEEYKVEFTRKMTALKTEFTQNALNEFKNSYTNDEIIAVYTEFTSDKINYTEETINFFKKFRQLKGQFSRSAKELYFQYQK